MALDPEVKRTLDIRLAKGEITVDEYRETLKSLEQADTARPAAAQPPRSVSQPRATRPPGPNGAPYVNVNVPRQPESVAFAVVTLLFWIFLAPIGFLLNIVGLFTGPKRGCFVSMLMLFVVLPIVVLVVLTAAGIPIAEEIAQALEEFFESL